MNYKLLDELHSNALKSKLSDDKINIIDKFGLKATEDLYWIQ